MKPHTLTALACILALAGSVHGDDDHDETPYIQVSGTAVTKVTPDVIVWRLTVTDENPDLSVAKAANDGKMARVLQAIDSLDVEPADVQTSHLRFDRVYEHTKHGRKGAFKHYRVVRTITVRQRDLDRFDEFLKDLVAGVDLEAYYTFESSKQEQVRWVTRLNALEIAKKKADDMAKVLDAEVGRPLRIEEQTTGWGRAANNFVNRADIAGAADTIAGTLAPGTIDVRVSVNVRFALD